MTAEAILAETSSTLQSIAMRGVTMVALPTVSPQKAARLHRKIYIDSMRRTIALAVKTTSTRLARFPLAKLSELLQQNESAFSSLPEHSSAVARRDALLRAMTCSWTKDIINAAIAQHPDMHLNTAVLNAETCLSGI